MLGGKVHNIETIKNKAEQNLAVLMVDLDSSQVQTTGPNNNMTVITFEIPILVHSTVLPPQKDTDSVETAIPKNAKVYINFIKPSVGNSLRGRYATDCLFDHDNFYGVGQIDENVDRRLVEQRHVLNFKMHKVCAGLTCAFLAIGLIIFFKILFMANHSSYGHGHKSHSGHHEESKDRRHEHDPVAHDRDPKVKTD